MLGGAAEPLGGVGRAIDPPGVGAVAATASAVVPDIDDAIVGGVSSVTDDSAFAATLFGGAIAACDEVVVRIETIITSPPIAKRSTIEAIAAGTSHLWRGLNGEAPGFDDSAMFISLGRSLREELGLPSVDMLATETRPELMTVGMFGSLGVRFGGGDVDVPMRRPGSARTRESSTRIEAADSQRSFLSKERHFATSASTFAGTPGSARARDRAWSVAAFTRCSELVSAICTCSPDRSVNIVAPTDQMSVRASTSRGRESACSGGMNAGVPTICPVLVDVADVSSVIRAIPKSSTLRTPELVTNRFDGLMSR